MGWQDAPVVAKPAGKAAWESAPVVGGTQLTGAAPVAAEPPAPKRTAGEAFGLGARDVLTGAGNIVNAPLEAVGGFAKGAAELAGYPKVGAAINKAVVPGNVGEMAANAMNLPKPVTAREKTQSSIQQGVTELAAPMVNMGTVNAARAVPKIVKGAADWAGTVPGKVAGAIEGHYGVPQTQKAALSAGRELAADQTARLGGEAAAHLAKGEQASATALSEGQKASATALSEAHSYEDLSTRLGRDLAESAKSGVPSIPKQGETLRGAMKGAYKVAKENRTTVTKPLYDAAEAQALALEKSGVQIDVTPALKTMDKKLADAQSIPALHNELSRMYAAVKDAKGYKALKTTSEYLKDIGYSGELQGYDRLVRQAALDLAGQVDAAITTQVPAHAVAAAKYADMSEPLATMSTRIGKAVTGGEGALKGDAFDKIANEDLPGRLFGKREGVEQVVHALAVGDKATPKQLDAAQKQVDQMVENWLMSSARGTAEAPKTGTAALDVLNKRSGTLEAVPGVGPRMRGQFEREAGKEKTMAELAKGSAEARSRAEAATAEAKKGAEAATRGAASAAKPLQSEQARVADMVKTADELVKAGNEKEALAKYTSAVRAGLANDQPKYQAALGWINRAETAKIKAERAKKLAKWIAGTTAIGATGYELGRHLP